MDRTVALMAERFTKEQVLSDDVDAFKDEESDFGDDQLCPYLLDLVQMVWTFQSQGYARVKTIV